MKYLKSKFKAEKKPQTLIEMFRKNNKIVVSDQIPYGTIIINPNTKYPMVLENIN